jgi:hypothetical protein
MSDWKLTGTMYSSEDNSKAAVVIERCEEDSMKVTVSVMESGTTCTCKVYLDDLEQIIRALNTNDTIF